MTTVPMAWATFVDGTAEAMLPAGTFPLGGSARGLPVVWQGREVGRTTAIRATPGGVRVRWAWRDARASQAWSRGGPRRVALEGDGRLVLEMGDAPPARTRARAGEAVTRTALPRPWPELEAPWERLGRWSRAAAPARPPVPGAIPLSRRQVAILAGLLRVGDAHRRARLAAALEARERMVDPWAL